MAAAPHHNKPIFRGHFLFSPQKRIALPLFRRVEKIHLHCLALRQDGVYRINGSFFASNQTPYKGPGGYTAMVSQYQVHFGIWGDVALAYLKGPHYPNKAAIENFIW